MAEFNITTDYEADWAVAKIKESEEEMNRLLTLAQEKIDGIRNQCAEIKEKHEKDTAFLRAKLEAYFDTVPHKKTETQESYKLLSGKLVRKRGPLVYDRDAEQLIPYLKTNYPSFVKTEESVMWMELKKNISEIQGKCYFTDTGEEIPGIVATRKPDTFDIK